MSRRVRGEAELQRNLDRLAKNYPNATVAALYQEGGVIFTGSQREVPVSRSYPGHVGGNLRQSGNFFVMRQGDGHVVIISYSASYALRIHEATEYDANRAQPGEFDTDKTTGKSKYLEDPFNEQMQGIEGRIARRVRMLLNNAPDPSTLPSVQGKRKGD